MAAWPFLSSGPTRYSSKKSYMAKSIFPIDWNGQVRAVRPETWFITNIYVYFKIQEISSKDFYSQHNVTSFHSF